MADAIPLIERTSGMIVVIRFAHSTRPAATALRRRFENFGMRPLGVVLNAVKARDTSGYHGYYGGTPASSSTGVRSEETESTGSRR